MAITRAQQAKQMLQDGGMLVKPGFGGTRQGYRGDAAYGDRTDKDAIGDGPAKSGPTNNQVDTGDFGTEAENVQQNISASLGGSGKSDPLQSVKKLQRFLNRRPTVKQLPPIGPFGIATNLFNKQFQRFSDFTTKKNRDFFQKVIGAGRLNLGGKTIDLETVGQMTDEELEDAYQDYMSARMNNEIDAYGNPINRGDGEGSNILIPQGIMAQAPSITEPELEEDEGLRLAFRANGGRIGLENGGISLQEAKDMAPKGEFLAYINAKEAKMLKDAGGSGIMTNAGIPSFVEYGGQSGFESAKSTGSVQGDVDRGRGDGPTKKPTGGGGKGPKTFQMVNPTFNKSLFENELKLQNFIDKIELENRLKEEEEDNKNLFTSGVDQSTVDTLFDPQVASNIQKVTTQTSDLLKQNPDLMETLGLAKAEGGRIGLMEGGMPYEGGIMDLESARQMYGLGKLVKKVTRTVKKIAKSPIGKAAILAAGGYYLGGGNLFGLQRAGMSGFSLGNLPGASFFGKGSFNPLKALSVGKDVMQSPFGKIISGIPGGGVTAGIIGVSALAGLLTPKQEEEAQALSTGEGIDIEAARRMILQAGTSGDKRALVFRADGGRIEYQEGSKEPVAKKTMPLLDMGGKEMDLREDGGFVPIGRMEKADDVPARLSKNEFVFTADAVRNAGDGDVDKGAEVMYNMMKNLEAGGDVSEESQGLEGARKMFQTSQRLEEVL